MTTSKRVTLTFDNGPTPGITDRVLEILWERRIAATFFVVGNRLDKPGGRELAERARAEGHWIGNHTLTHTTPLGVNPDAEYAKKEIEGAQNRIAELTHEDKLFRPLGSGRIGPHLLSRAALAYLQDQKYTCVLWSSVPGDYKDPHVWVEKGLLDIEAHDWTVVALHDIENASLARLPEFLDRLGALGTEFRQDFPTDVLAVWRGGLMPSLASRITQ